MNSQSISKNFEMVRTISSVKFNIKRSLNAAKVASGPATKHSIFEADNKNSSATKDIKKVQ